ncbi:MAG: ATP-binding cassette domain-containing protein [Chloroflexota bacterium]
MTTSAAQYVQTGNNHSLIALRQVQKVFKSEAGSFQALKSIDLEIGRGEFVGIIGRSGSGKSTLINMITGIDRPTSGEVLVDETAVHTLSENQMARWRGRNLGIVFQFFQLLPNLSVIENVMMPMDLCNTYPLWERRKRALRLLEMVEMQEQAEKLPSALSGGQQQRVAIARALANNPSLIIADEPTGNLDSKTADVMFKLFENLAAEGKTVVMVTHDSSLARRVSRTVLIVDGEVVNEYVARALPYLPPPLLLEATHRVQAMTFQPGATIIKENEPGQNFYIISKGTAEVVLKRPSGEDVVADRLQPGQYFGEVSLLHSSRTIAAVRAAPEASVEVLALDAESFQNLINASPDFESAVHSVANERMARTQSAQEGV